METPKGQDMTDLAQLLERVEGASGPDREIDAALFNALIEDGGRYAFKITDWQRGRAPHLDRYHDGWLVGKSEDDIYAEDPVRFTASVDAAVALVECVLPTIPRPEPYGPWEWRVHGPNRNDNGMCRAALMWPQSEAGAHVFRVGPTYASNPALALIAALLRAKIAESQP